MDKTDTYSRKEIEKNLNQVFWSTVHLFEDGVTKGLSENYKQAFVFRCLNVLKGRDKDKFLWELIRLLNSRRDTDLKNVDSLIYALQKASCSLDDETFFKHAYAFLLGMMKSNTRKIENDNQSNL